MAFHVKNGTPLDGPSLCETCANSLVARGYRETEALVICTAISPSHRVTFRIRECSSYIDRTRQPLYELQKIAWELKPRGSKRQAGFVSPAERNGDEDEIELILDGNK